MVRSSGTVCVAAVIDCASTWPPNTRPSGIHCDGPVKMSSFVRAPVSVSRNVLSRPSIGPFMLLRWVGRPLYRLPAGARRRGPRRFSVV